MFYTMSGPDNDAHMCGSTDVLHHEDVPNIPFCEHCGFKTEPFFVNPKFRIRKPYDFSYTYDGYPIASLKLKELCARSEVSGTRFVELTGDPQNFLLRSDETAAFDAETRQTVFEDYCETCGLFGAIAGATPAFLKAAPIFDLTETDVHFGSGNEKSPLLIVSEHFRPLLAREKMKGPRFEPVTIVR